MLQRRMDIGDLFLAVLAFDKIIDIFHGTRAIQGIHGDEVFDLSGFQFFQKFAHS